MAAPSQTFERLPGKAGGLPDLVDLTYYPLFEQWAVLEHFRGVQLPTGLDRLKQWWETMKNRESVRAIAHPSAFYLEQYGQLEQARKAQTANPK
jgi:glutathione S-transferase